MDFRDGSRCTFEAEQQPIVNVGPALGGAIFYVEVRGRPTQHGNGAMPLHGSLQFVTRAEQPLPWPIFALKQGGRFSGLSSDGSESLYFEGLLSSAQIEALEKVRNGRDFDVGIKANISVLTASGTVANWYVQDSYLHKTAQEWLTILERAGFKKYLFLEMAFPADAAAGGDSALPHLIRARELFDKGLYRECVTNLRMTQEKLRNKRGDKVSIDRAKNAYREGRQGMSFEQRMLFAREAVHNVLQLGPHPDEDERAFNRENAKALLTMVSALVELYPEPSEPVED
jgi:hypothetical protein